MHDRQYLILPVMPDSLASAYCIFKIITIPYYYSDYYSHSFKRLNRRKLNHEKSSTEKHRARDSLFC
nr:MAG TPA: hypothetical protein [Caudoviricetes sp.]